MSTVTAILEVDEDGTVHLPLPSDILHRRVRVTATVEPAEAIEKKTPVPGSLKGFWMAPDFDEPLDDFKEYME